MKLLLLGVLLGCCCCTVASAEQAATGEDADPGPLPKDEMTNGQPDPEGPPAQEGLAQEEYMRDVSIHAQQTILDLKQQLNFTTISASPVAIYRKDLPDYVAYWMVVFDTSYVIISAGPQTGDRKMKYQGEMPGGIQQLEDDAEDSSLKCTQFFMLTPDGEMMCEGANGTAVASTIHAEVFRQEFGSDEIVPAVLHQFIQSKLADLRVEWARHMDEVYRSGEWFDEQFATAEQASHLQVDDLQAADNDDAIDPDSMESEMEMGAFGTKTNENFQEQEIDAGEAVQLAVGDPAMLLECSIKYLPTNNTNGSLAMQHKLCAVVGICDDQNEENVKKEAIQKDAGTGIHFLNLHIPKDAKETLEGADVGFSVQIKMHNGDEIIRHFAIVYPASRQRRSTEYGSWSSWRERSIPYEYYFPDYNQHTAGRCAVGCGPVAWAQIFGYFDRRSHYRNSRYGSGSKGLWKCGRDATTGSTTCIAPHRETSQMRLYTEVLNRVMGTFCFVGQGATLINQMKKVYYFYKARQTSGNPQIITRSNWMSWLGIRQSSIAEWARSRIDEGWPVVVGTHEGFLKWHYPVATKYRKRSRHYRNCIRIFWKVCGSWKTSTEYQMYTHQGWGGSSNGWRDMRVYYAAAARY